MLALAEKLLAPAQNGGMHRAQPEASALVLGVVLTAVLQAFQQKVAAHGRDDAIRLPRRALERGVPARLNRQHVACRDMAVGPAFVLAVGRTPANRGAQFQREAVALAASREADADAAAAALAFGLLFEGVARGLQHYVAFGLEHHVVACRHVRARDGNVGVFTSALRNDGQVLARGDGRAVGARRAAIGGAGALARAQAELDADTAHLVDLVA